MDMPDFVEIIAPKAEPVKVTKLTPPTTVEVVEEKPAGPDWATILAPVAEGLIVNHKKFGDGKITWMDKAKKYLRATFTINGQDIEKQFIFPDAFIGGFLTIKD